MAGPYTWGFWFCRPGIKANSLHLSDMLVIIAMVVMVMVVVGDVGDGSGGGDNGGGDGDGSETSLRTTVYYI